jgi:hypothetical protein
MGYYADGSGSVVFDRILDDREKSTLRDEISYFSIDIYDDKESSRTCVDIWDHDKYYSEIVEEILDYISKFANIVEGEIDYIGEDYSMWRYIYQNGSWEEQYGHVVYE